MTVHFSTDPTTTLVPLIPVPAPTTAVSQSTSSNVTAYWGDRIVKNEALAEKLLAIFQQVMQTFPTDLARIIIGYCVDLTIKTMSLDDIGDAAFADEEASNKSLPFPYYRIIINKKYYIPIQVIIKEITLPNEIQNKTKDICICESGTHCIYLAPSTEEPPIATLVEKTGTGSLFEYNTDKNYPKRFQAGVQGDRVMIYPRAVCKALPTYTLIGIGIASYEVEKVTVSKDK